MDITADTLRTICNRGRNLESEEKIDKIATSCLRDAINGFDFASFPYDEHNEQEVSEMKEIAKKLEKRGFRARLDGDEDHMSLYVSWWD